MIRLPEKALIIRALTRNKRRCSLSVSLNEILTGAAGKLGPSLARPSVAFLTVSGDWTRLADLQRSLFNPEQQLRGASSRLALGVIPREMREPQVSDVEFLKSMSRVQWIIGDIEHEPTRKIFERLKAKDQSSSSSFPRLWLGFGDLTEEQIRRTLFHVRLEGPGRHMIHSLAIRSREHLKAKRVVAEYWVAVCSLLSAGKGAIPSFPFLTDASADRGENQEFWRIVCGRAVHSCYGMSQDDAIEAEIVGRERGLGIADFVTVARHAGLGFAKAKMIRTALKRSPRLFLKSMPWLTGAVTAATLFSSGRKAYHDCKDFGLSMVDDLESRWMESLGSSHD